MPDEESRSALHARAEALATEDDDDFGGPAPIVIVGPVIGTLMPCCLVADALAGPAKVAVPAGIAVVGVLVMILCVRTGLRRSRARARAAVLKAVSWIEDHGGAQCADAALSQLTASGALTSFVKDWKCLGHRLEATPISVEDLLVASVAAGEFSLAGTVREEWYPRTSGSGWTTDRHVYDVIPATLGDLVASGEFSPAAFRAALRRRLYAPA